MKKKMYKTSNSTILFTLICGLPLAVELPAQCKPLPVTFEVLIDWTNSGSFDKNALEGMLFNIVPNLPDHSRVYINAIGEKFCSEIISFDTPHHDYQSLLDSWRNYSVARSGNRVNLRLVDEELGRRFTVNEYRQMAELVLFIVDAKTETTGEALFFYKKKATIGVFGDHIPNNYRTMASDEKHLYLLGKDVPLANVTETILNQIFCDSHFLCDRGQFRARRGYRCMNCSNVCGDGNSESLTCTRRCPFLYRPSPKEEKISSKQLSGGSIAAIVVSSVLFILLVGIILWREKLRTFVKTFRKDKFPVPEAEGDHTDEGLSGNPNTSSGDEADDTGANADTGSVDHSSTDAEHLSSAAGDSISDESVPLFGSQTDLPQPNTVSVAEKEMIPLTVAEIEAHHHIFNGSPVKKLHEDSSYNLAA